MATLRSLVTGKLRREQAAGTVSPEADVELVAERMVRISRACSSTWTTREQLRDIARRFLVPMLALIAEPGAWARPGLGTHLA